MVFIDDNHCIKKFTLFHHIKCKLALNYKLEICDIIGEKVPYKCENLLKKGKRKENKNNLM